MNPDTLQGLDGLLLQAEVLGRAGAMAVSWPSTVLSMSPGLLSMLGLSGPGDAPLDALDWVPLGDRDGVGRAWREAVPGVPFEIEHGACTADGRRLRVRQRGLLHVPAEPGGVPCGTAHLQDISAEHEAACRATELTSVDPGTGLANRSFLLQVLDTALHAVRTKGAGFALLAIEVPRIAELAVSMDLGAGGALAAALATRLREASVPGAMLAYLGTGTFALVVRQPPAAARTQALQQAAEVKAALEQAVTLRGVEIFPRCRIGIAVVPGDAETPPAWLEAARSARREAPASGGVALFKPVSGARVLRALQLETGLRHAIGAGELSLAYQPQVCLASGQIIGAEALLRWQSAQFGAVEADEFIPVAERSGLIVDIGKWVLRQACEQLKQWRQAGLVPVRVAVNISPLQFQLGDVALDIRSALADTGVDAGLLALELTEAALRHDGERVTATLKALSASGLQIVLDDFGTGSSSLSSLRSLPVALVKIDRSFIRDITSEPESASVARSIISLAHGLKIPVLAEGVENEGQLAMLAADGCDHLQGYLFSAPVAAGEMTAMLRSGRRLDQHLVDKPARTRTLLVVDDEPNILSALKRLFRRDGYRVLSAGSGAEGLEVLAAHTVDVILSDQRMPGMMGTDFLRRTKELHPHTVRMTLSGFTDLQSIIDAVNEGAVYKFLTKPWDDDRLREHVAQAFAHKEMADENRRLQGAVTVANAEQALLNQRLERLLARQAAQTQLTQASASSLRGLVDALPAAVFGIDPEGLLAFVNQPALALLPQACAGLGLECGGAAGDELGRLYADLRRHGSAGGGLPAVVQGRRFRAWLQPMPDDGSERGAVLALLPETEVRDA